MVWKERSRVDERLLLVGEYMKGERPMAELCREFGVSRKTAYKWLSRYETDGPTGLADRSRAPLRHPQRVEQIVIEALVQARKSHPHWGARKILAWLARKQPSLELPASSTVNAVFAKYGLSRSPPSTSANAAVYRPVRRSRRSESSLVCRLQGRVQNRRRQALLPPHSYGRFQPNATAVHRAAFAEDGSRPANFRSRVSRIWTA